VTPLSASWPLPPHALADLTRYRDRTEMERFVRWTWAQAQPYKWGWHNRALCRYLDAMVAGKIRKLMVFMPPRHGKSELVSRRLPAYWMGRHPDDEVIAVSHTAKLADQMSRDVQRIIDHPRYAYLFPDTRLYAGGGRSATRNAMRAVRTQSYFEVVGRRGRYRSAGVGGAIVGMGFRLGVIDDPYKDAEEATSEVIREKVEEWYRSVFATRQAPDAAQLLMLHRWHHDDLAGVLLREDPDGWEVLSFPAVSGEERHPADKRTGPGQALWPEQFDLAFLDAMRKSVGSLWWEALYQQRPLPEGGLLFRRGWFGHYRDGGDYWHVAGRGPIHKSDCTVLATVDPAASEKETADCTAIPVGVLTPLGDLLILEVVNKRLGVHEIPREMLAVALRHGVEFFGVEDTGFQVAVINEARKVPGMPPIRELSPNGKGKVVRATPAIIKAEAGQVFVPAHTGPRDAPDWLMPFFDQLERFRGEDEPNDMVDGFAWLVRQCPRLVGEKSTPDQDAVMERLALKDREEHARSRNLWGR